MRLEYFPYYCGGRILTGLFFNTISDDEIIKHSLEHQVKYKEAYDSLKIYNTGQSHKENPTFEATCVLWSVDVHNVLMPKLEELKLIEEKKNEPNKRVFKST